MATYGSFFASAFAAVGATIITKSQEVIFLTLLASGLVVSGTFMYLLFRETDVSDKLLGQIMEATSQPDYRTIAEQLAPKNT